MKPQSLERTQLLLSRVFLLYFGCATFSSFSSVYPLETYAQSSQSINERLVNSPKAAPQNLRKAGQSCLQQAPVEPEAEIAYCTGWTPRSKDEQGNYSSSNSTPNQTEIDEAEGLYTLDCAQVDIPGEFRILDGPRRGLRCDPEVENGHRLRISERRRKHYVIAPTSCGENDASDTTAYSTELIFSNAYCLFDRWSGHTAIYRWYSSFSQRTIVELRTPVRLSLEDCPSCSTDGSGSLIFSRIDTQNYEVFRISRGSEWEEVDGIEELLHDYIEEYENKGGSESLKLQEVLIQLLH